MGADRDRDGRRGRGHWLPPVAALCALASACGGPSLAVQTEPAGAILFVDGRQGSDAEPLPFRYYGRRLLQVEPPIEGDEWRHVGLRRLVTVNEPVTPWIFPLDLPGELVLRGFSGADDQSVVISLVENPTRVVLGLEPEGAADLRARSARSRVSR